jgi:hypothetical protein
LWNRIQISWWIITKKVTLTFCHEKYIYKIM